MILSKVPYNRRDIVGALVVGYNNQWPFFGHIEWIGKVESRSQKIQAPQRKKVKPIN
jgi:hypothetical protein